MLNYSKEGRLRIPFDKPCTNFSKKTHAFMGIHPQLIKRLISPCAVKNSLLVQQISPV
jgi:hypothetical protein